MDNLRDYSPIPIPNPDSSMYGIFKAGPKGGMTFFPRNIIKYLGDRWIVFDGHTPRMFNGKSYEVLPEKKFDLMIIKAVDSYGIDQMLSSTQINSIIRTADAVLDFDQLPYFDDAEDIDNYSVVEHQQVVGGLFAFGNGILNTANGKFLPFTRHLMVRSCYNCRYDPSITQCRAEEIIKGILPDPDTRRFFYEMVGYILFSGMNPPAIFVIYGPGGTGKSALSNMISTLIGSDLISTVALSQLSDRFMPAMLEGKVLNISGETGEGRNKYNPPDGEKIKQLSDGQEITVERKHMHPYKIRNTAKLLFITNTVPDFGDTSSGLYRRLYTIPCRVKQDPTANIYNLMTDPDSLSWLANRALEAYMVFKARGFTFQPSREMTAEWENMRALDPVFDFLYTTFDSTDMHVICEKIVADAEYRKTRILYTTYREYCYSNNVTPMGSRKFYEKLRNETELDIGKNPIVYRIDGVATSTRVFILKNALQGTSVPKTGGGSPKP